jgi:oxygen-independent coproporphyrinogen-3 oxidase
MRVFLDRKDFRLNVSTFFRTYLPYEEIEYVEDNYDLKFNIEDDFIGLAYYVNGHKKSESYYTKQDLLKLDIPQEEKAKRKRQKKLIRLLIYDVALEVTGKEQPWGILTGIRPTKVVFKLIDKYGLDELVSSNTANIREGYNSSKIIQSLKDDYRISDEKIKLLLNIVNKEYPILNKNKEKEVNIYIGIPFCPTRCLYCSFTSYPIDKWKDRVNSYLDALRREVEFVSKSLDGRHIRTLYIGGGTPTSLDYNGLKVLMDIVNSNYDITTIDEFTVEAGRPDTITLDKLKLLKDSGVNRISINPQTMNQKTLDIIGRRHSTKEIYKAYEEAKSVGFESINMDLIVGLPEETSEDVFNTMKEISKLSPDNLTVHTMAIKRASKLKEERSHYNLTSEDEIREMIKITADMSLDMGLEPYYMYRQKNMLGNFENVGYATRGKECIYNVEIIEEQQSIIAMGAGATSKIVFPDKSIKRIENVKNVEHYISRVDEMIDRKRRVL